MISSTSNDKIKYMEKLRKSASFRREEGLFPVEGIRMVREIPADRLQYLYYTEKAYEKNEQEIQAVYDGCMKRYGVDDGSSSSDALRQNEKRLNSMLPENDWFQPVSDACMKKMSDTETPQGIIAAVRMEQCSLEDVTNNVMDHHDIKYGERNDDNSDYTGEADGRSGLDKSDICFEPLILILEKLQDPGNLGTIIRTAEAAGVTGIILSKDCADIYNPKTVRSTMGAVFRMKIYVSEDILKDIERIKDKGVKVYAMHLSGSEFYEKDFTKGTAFLIGNEGNGLSPEVSAAADEMMRIPMMGKVESLNAAISASVVSYEALRQRRGK